MPTTITILTQTPWAGAVVLLAHLAWPAADQHQERCRFILAVLRLGSERRDPLTRSLSRRTAARVVEKAARIIQRRRFEAVAMLKRMDLGQELARRLKGRRTVMIDGVRYDAGRSVLGSRTWAAVALSGGRPDDVLMRSWKPSRSVLHVAFAIADLLQGRREQRAKLLELIVEVETWLEPLLKAAERTRERIAADETLKIADAMMLQFVPARATQRHRIVRARAVKVPDCAEAPRSTFVSR